MDAVKNTAPSFKLKNTSSIIVLTLTRLARSNFAQHTVFVITIPIRQNPNQWRCAKLNPGPSGRWALSAALSAPINSFTNGNGSLINIGGCTASGGDSTARYYQLPLALVHHRATISTGSWPTGCPLTVSASAETGGRSADSATSTPAQVVKL